MTSASVETITLLYLIRSHADSGILSIVSCEGEYRLSITVASRATVAGWIANRKVRLMRQDDLVSIVADVRLFHLIVVFRSLLSISAMLMMPAVNMLSIIV